MNLHSDPYSVKNKGLLREHSSLFIDLSVDCFCVANPEGYLVDLNENWSKVLGWSLEELTAVPYTEFIHPDDLDSTCQVAKSLFEGNRVENFVNRYRKKSGGYVHLSWRALVDFQSNLVFAIASDVTHLMVQGELFQATQKAANIGVWEVDLAQNLCEWSDVTYEIHQVPNSEVIKVEDGINYYVEEHRPIITQCVENAVAHRKSWDVELQILTRTGQKKWVRAVGFPVIENNQIAKLRGTFQDIDEIVRRRLENEQLTERLALAIEGTGLGIWDWDLTTNAVRFDQRYCEMIGLDLDTVDHEFSTWEKRVHPDDMDPAKTAISEYLEGRSSRYEVIFRMKHETEDRWVHILSRGRVSARDPVSNEPIRFTGTHSDVSLIEEARRQVENRRRLLNEMVENLPASVALFDREIRYIATSKKWLKDYGITEQDLAGKSHYEIFPEISEQWKAVHQRALSGETIVNECDPFPRKDGSTMYLRWDVRPWYDRGEIAGILMLTEDITEQKNSQTLLLDAMEKAKSAAQARSRMLSNMSHEIRTPLNAILGVSELLSETELDSTQAEYVDLFQRAGKTLLDLVNDILDYSRIDSGRFSICPEPVQVLSAVDDVSKIMEFSADQKGLTFTKTIKNITETTWVEMDTKVFSQIVINLCGNAIKFTEPGGVVDFGIELINSEQLSIVVKDTGVGISPDKLATIFEPFEQEDNSVRKSYGGTGLGLSITKGLVEAMEGSIKIESTPNKGTMIQLVFPAREVAAPKEPTLKPTETIRKLSSGSTNGRILIVDDVEENRFLMERFLAKESYELDFAIDGKDAISKFRKNRYDVIYMDIQMPVVDGYTATKEMRKIEKAEKRVPTPIIALTGFSLPEEIKKALDAGYDGHISKPVRRKKIVEDARQRTVGAEPSKQAA